MRFPRVVDLVVSATGLEPALVRGRVAEQAIDERLHRLGIAREDDYLRVLKRDGDEVERLAEAVAVPETSLFRYPDSFEFLRRWLVERRAAAATGARLQMASVGCATGEEAYSMAVTALAAGWPAEAVTVDAVDRNPRVIERAAAARYPVRSATTAPAWARTWLLADGDAIVVHPAPRAVVQCARGDALARALPADPGRDVVFCRNVLVYLGAAPRRRLLARLDAAVAPGGRLFVGHAEQGTAQVDGRFVAIDAPRSFVLGRAADIGAPAHPAGRDVRGRVATAPPFTARTSVPVTTPPVTTPPVTTPPVTTPPVTARPAGRVAPRATTAAPPAPRLRDARALADRGKLAAALDAIGRIVERDGPSANALELLGSVHLARNDPASAHECFFRAVYLDPDHEPSLLQLALISAARGDATQAASYRARAERAHRREDGP